MNSMLFSFALLASPMVIPVSDRVPELKVEALCKATSETDKAMGLALAQTPVLRGASKNRNKQ